MQIKPHIFPITISMSLIQVFQMAIDDYGGLIESDFCIQFKHPKYGPRIAELHPVEVGIEQSGQLLYITDHCLVGTQPDVELVQSLKFDFQFGRFQQLTQDLPIKAGAEVFSLWQYNFLKHYGKGLYHVLVGSL